MNYNNTIDFTKLLPESWLKIIDPEILNRCNDDINQEIVKCKEENKEIYPYNVNDIFKIFNLCDIQDIKVVILGMDPYHSDKNQANGIAFSVNKDVKIPPSLRNIFKEMGCHDKKDGDLEYLVRRGVFLLNTFLTVKQKTPGSHKFWKDFSDHIIKLILENNQDAVFILFGKFAQDTVKISSNIDSRIFCTSHPSPLSAYKPCGKFPAFIGSNIFKIVTDKTGILFNKM
jgi:uracil-DNA glycosylase